MKDALPQGAATRPDYFPQLDTLRALAIGLVLLEHWANPIADVLGVHGGYGVWLFFTLSGYLITGILLRYRDAITSGAVTVATVMRVFFARRFLRILPVYYLFLASAYLVGRLHADAAPWHLAYLSNFYFWREGEFQAMGHLWSLSVEEQFYLVWPAAIVLITRARLPIALVCAIGFAPLFRLAATYFDWGLASYVFPFAALDTLGLGALLAWLERNPQSRLNGLLRPARLLALVALPFIGFAPKSFYAPIAPLVIGLISTWLIAGCVRGLPGMAGRIADFRPIQYLGRISYGLYLYHALATWLVHDLIGDTLIAGYYRNMVLLAAVKAVMLLAIASASWFLFEKPINRLKRRFRLTSQFTVAPEGIATARGEAGLA